MAFFIARRKEIRFSSCCAMFSATSCAFSTAVTSEGKEVFFINASASGVFVQAASHSDYLKTGDHIGDIIDPLTGEIRDKILSPCDGLLFTLREYPVVYTGSLIARVLGGVSDD